jgi:hypothetical protein
LEWIALESGVLPEARWAGANYLNGVWAVSSDQAWAVGNSWNQPIIGQWNGHAWNLVDVPTDGRADRLSAVASSAGAAWAVGGSYADGNGNGATKGLIYAWDGSAWNLVTHPEPPGSHYSFHDLVVFSPRDVWVVGTTWSPDDDGPAEDAGPVPLFEHWDGSRWLIVEGPDVGSSNVSAIAVGPGGDLWAVGTRFMAGVDQPLVVVGRCG